MSTGAFPNRVRGCRLARGWSQEVLAARAGISRTGVSAIEAGRLVPSVAAALSLASALDCTVEELFDVGGAANSDPTWAVAPEREPCRYWLAKVGTRLLAYPTEPATADIAWHDGVHAKGRFTATDEATGGASADETLVLACCDPAAALLAAEYRRTTPFRMIVLRRSSRQSLELLEQGFVHAAGIHLAYAGDRAGNATAVRSALPGAFNLLRVARWQEGLAIAPAWRGKSVRAVLQSRARWIGREPGSGARRCLDDLLEGRAAPRQAARDHQGVATAIVSGWADAGVCHRLTCEEAGLRFLPLQEEDYDLCFTRTEQDDPRVKALLEVVRSSSYRRRLGDLPGYQTRRAGELQSIQP